MTTGSGKGASAADRSPIRGNGAQRPEKNRLDRLSPHECPLRTAIQHMREVVILIDKSFRVLEINDSALRYLGYPPGTRDLVLTADIDPGRVTDDTGRVLTWEDSIQVRAVGGKTVHNEIQVLHRKDGTINYMLMDGYPIGADGAVEMALMIGRDITHLREEQIRAEKMLDGIVRQERTLQSVLDHMPANVLVLDTDLKLLAWNNYHTRCEKSIRRWRVGIHLENALPYARECGLADMFRSALESGRAVSHQEFMYRLRDGSHTYWNGSATPIDVEHEGGRMRVLAVVAVDVTEQVKARERMAELAAEAQQRAIDLEAERARFGAILECMPVPVCVLDTEGRTVSYNAAHRDLALSLGYQERHLQGMDPKLLPKMEMRDSRGEVVEPSDSPAFRALRGETCHNTLLSVRPADGPTRSFSVSAAPLRDPNGETVGAVQASWEVTDQMRAHARVQEMYRRERAVAEKLQRSFVLDDFPEVEGFELGRRYEAALKADLVGGDFYDVFRLNDGRIALVMGDVAGKGLKAAVYTAMTKYMLRAYALEDPRPRTVLSRLNEALEFCTPLDVFVTLAYAVLDPRTRTLEYANAGHEQPVHVSCGSRVAVGLDVTGRALALGRGAEYGSRTLSLRPGDIVVFFTDGITDAGFADRRLGPERVLEIIGSCVPCSARELIDTLLAKALRHAGGKLSDDAALLAIKAL
jgi:PAS domain S-box-containing protein